MRHRSCLALIFLWFCGTPAAAAPQAELWAFWDKADASSARVVDHATWQEFLDNYVTTGEDGINRVAYRLAAADGGRELLNGYLQQLTSVDPRVLAPDEQLAYWINLYNALTIEVILRYPRKGSILRMGKGFFSVGPWDDKLLTIAGREITLNDIEHRILRPIWRDHRIHFAVNCASLGCPNLARTAYTRDNVADLLEQGELDYINHPRGAQIDGSGNLRASSIFEWYQVDFAGDETTLKTYLASRHRTLAGAIADHEGRIKYDYDWALNAREPR